VTFLEASVICLITGLANLQCLLIFDVLPKQKVNMPKGLSPQVRGGHVAL